MTDPIEDTPLGGMPQFTVADILGAPKEDPVPDEDTEEFARNMRMVFTACIRQGFTEDQALKIVGITIAAMIDAAKGAEQ